MEQVSYEKKPIMNVVTKLDSLCPLVEQVGHLVTWQRHIIKAYIWELFGGFNRPLYIFGNVTFFFVKKTGHDIWFDKVEKIRSKFVSLSKKKKTLWDWFLPNPTLEYVIEKNDINIIDNTRKWPNHQLVANK